MSSNFAKVIFKNFDRKYKKVWVKIVYLRTWSKVELNIRPMSGNPFATYAIFTVSEETVVLIRYFDEAQCDSILCSLKAEGKITYFSQIPRELRYKKNYNFTLSMIPRSPPNGYTYHFLQNNKTKASSKIFDSDGYFFF